MQDRADLTYIDIYEKAEESIIVVDDYIGVKTLNLLGHAKPGVHVTIVSDNKSYAALSQTEYNDFVAENLGRDFTFVRSQGRSHDRYIVIDIDTDNMKIYHCGASSRNAGGKITTIDLVTDLVEEHRNAIYSFLGNEPLVLR